MNMKYLLRIWKKILVSKYKVSLSKESQIVINEAFFFIYNLTYIFKKISIRTNPSTIRKQHFPRCI